MRRKGCLRVVMMLGALATATVAQEARADLAPPPGLKKVQFDLTVTGLSAVPDLVMFAYPVSASNGAPTSELWKLEDAMPVRLGWRSPLPRLYLMRAAAFEKWRAANPAKPRASETSAAEALVASSEVVACDPVVAPGYLLESERAESTVQQTLELVDGRAGVCTLRQKSRTDTVAAERIGMRGGSGFEDEDEGSGCALATSAASAYASVLVAAGVLLVRSRRRRTRGTSAD